MEVLLYSESNAVTQLKYATTIYEWKFCSTVNQMWKYAMEYFDFYL